MSRLSSYDRGMRILYALEYLHNLPEPEPGDEYVHVTQAELAKYFSEEYKDSIKRETIKKMLDAIHDSDTGYRLTREESYGGQTQYFYRRTFTIEQLSLLSSIICSSIFLSETEIDKLLEQLKTLTSEENAQKLSASNHFLRPRMINGEALDNLRIIHQAINDDRALRFYIGSIDVDKHICYDKISIYSSKGKRITYMDSDGKDKKEEPITSEPNSDQGRPIICHPYALAWDNSRCYLICGVEKNDKITLWNYRVDRMFELKELENIKRRLPRDSEFYDDRTNTIDAERYLHSIFKMFPNNKSTDEVTLKSRKKLTDEVTFKFRKKLTRVIVEKFGFDVQITDLGDGYAQVKVAVQISQQFYGWLAGFEAKDLRMIEPDSEVKKYIEYLQNAIKYYNADV